MGRPPPPSQQSYNPTTSGGHHLLPTFAVGMQGLDPQSDSVNLPYKPNFVCSLVVVVVGVDKQMFLNHLCVQVFIKMPCVIQNVKKSMQRKAPFQTVEGLYVKVLGGSSIATFCIISHKKRKDSTQVLQVLLKCPLLSQYFGRLPPVSWIGSQFTAAYYVSVSCYEYLYSMLSGPKVETWKWLSDINISRLLLNFSLLLFLFSV